MMSNVIDTAMVQRYARCHATTPEATLPLGEALDAIRTGQWRLPIAAVRGIYQHGTTAAYTAAKARLPAYTFGGTFTPTRANAHLTQHSGIVVGDIDHADDPQALKAQLAQDPHVAFAFLSPSGYGLKVGVCVPVVSTAEAYHHAWTVLAAHYDTATGVPWDPAAAAVATLCFVSDDPELYWSPAVVAFPVPEPPPGVHHTPTTPATRDGMAATTAGMVATTAAQRYAQHALKTAVRWIRKSQPGTKHWTRLRVARLVGGHVATGALDYDTAYTALHDAIEATTDNLPNAERPLLDGLARGQQVPIPGPQVDQVEAAIAGVDDDGTLPAPVLATPQPQVAAASVRRAVGHRILPCLTPRLTRRLA